MEYPQYLMIIDGVKKFMTLKAAGVTYDSWFNKVEIGNLVILDANLNCRSMTQEDERQISDIADEHSASK